MTLKAIIRVPAEDRGDLANLTEAVENDGVRQVKAFDGVTLLQTLILVTSATYPFVRTWLSNRTEARKSFSIVLDGVVMNGYSLSEALRVIDRLDRRLGRMDAQYQPSIGEDS